MITERKLKTGDYIYLENTETVIYINSTYIKMHEGTKYNFLLPKYERMATEKEIENYKSIQN